MILVDANLLIYAVNRDAPNHLKAKQWLEQTVSGSETVLLTWNVLLAFVRITTKSGLFHSSLNVATAFGVIEAWTSQPSVTIAGPGPNHMRSLRDLLLSTGTGGNLSSDAHLAAIAIERGATLYTTDNDFSRFPGLSWRNPLL